MPLTWSLIVTTKPSSLSFPAAIDRKPDIKSSIFTEKYNKNVSENGNLLLII
jgi:hypothetical protein